MKKELAQTEIEASRDTLATSEHSYIQPSQILGTCHSIALSG